MSTEQAQIGCLQILHGEGCLVGYVVNTGLLQLIETADIDLLRPDPAEVWPYLDTTLALPQHLLLLVVALVMSSEPNTVQLRSLESVVSALVQIGHLLRKDIESLAFLVNLSCGIFYTSCLQVPDSASCRALYRLLHTD